MKIAITYIGLLMAAFAPASIMGQGLGFEWCVAMRGDSIDYGQSVTVNQHIYVAGYFQGTVDFDPGSSIEEVSSTGGKDIFIQKLNLDGTLTGSKRLAE